MTYAEFRKVSEEYVDKQLITMRQTLSAVRRERLVLDVMKAGNEIRRNHNLPEFPTLPTKEPTE